MIPAGCQQQPPAAATAHLSTRPSGSAQAGFADWQNTMHAHLGRLSVADDQVLDPLLLIGGQVDVVVLADVVKQDARLLLVLPARQHGARHGGQRLKGGSAMLGGVVGTGCTTAARAPWQDKEQCAAAC